MKKYFFLLLTAALLLPFCVSAQETSIVVVTPKQITDIVEGSKGKIEVIIPDDINQNIFPQTRQQTPQNVAGTNNGSNTGNATGTTANNTNTASIANTGKKNGNNQQGKNQANNQTKQQQQNANKNNTAQNNAAAAAAKKSGKATMKKMQGFRIQVFSDGQNPQTLQARARARGNAIVARFPKYRGQVYTFSSSPNWYTRVGNFETQAEASKALGELKRAFPQFAGEMRIVKSPVTIVK